MNMNSKLVCQSQQLTKNNYDTLSLYFLVNKTTYNFKISKMQF